MNDDMPTESQPPGSAAARGSATSNPNPLPESKCPVCGYVMDAATCFYDEAARPTPGDISLCMKCGEPQVYTEQLTLRPAEIKDLLALDEEANKQLLKAQRLIRRVRILDGKSPNA